MLNCEKYREEIEKLEYDFYIKNSDGKLVSCSCSRMCKDCKLSSYYNDDNIGCSKRKIRWLMSEYKEPTYEVDWTKVPIDTPVICYTESGKQFKRHFAGIDGKLPAAFPFGMTSWSDDKEFLSTWTRVELAEQHPEWMKEVEE